PNTLQVGIETSRADVVRVRDGVPEDRCLCAHITLTRHSPAPLRNRCMLSARTQTVNAQFPPLDCGFRIAFSNPRSAILNSTAPPSHESLTLLLSAGTVLTILTIPLACASPAGGHR